MGRRFVGAVISGLVTTARPEDQGQQAYGRMRMASQICPSGTSPHFVIAGHSRPKDGVASARLCPAIHLLRKIFCEERWMPGSSPGMTTEYDEPRLPHHPKARAHETYPYFAGSSTET
jgi:hypothetical protein